MTTDPTDLAYRFLFDWPLDPWTQQLVVDEKPVDTSRKMMVLERLLEALFEGCKVLIFLQFATMLNVIEVSVPTLNMCHLFMDDGDDRIWHVRSNAGHCAAWMFDGPIGTLCGDGLFPTWQQQARRPTALLSEHVCGLAGH